MMRFWNWLPLYILNLLIEKHHVYGFPFTLCFYRSSICLFQIRYFSPLIIYYVFLTYYLQFFLSPSDHLFLPSDHPPLIHAPQYIMQLSVLITTFTLNFCLLKCKWIRLCTITTCEIYRQQLVQTIFLDRSSAYSM